MLLLAAFGVLFAVLTIVSDRLAGVVWGIALLAYLGMIIPNISVMVRRLHDTDRSGWWYWIGLLPFGGIFLLVWFCTQGTPGGNDYGDDPLPRGLVDTFR